jgi:hypothetical protein
VFLKRRFRQVEEGRRSRHCCVANLHAVGGAKESSLKAAIVTKGLMEESTPCSIGKITIDVGNEVVRERAAHIVTLHEAAVHHELRKVCAHSIVKCGHASHRRQLE